MATISGDITAFTASELSGEKPKNAEIAA